MDEPIIKTASRNMFYDENGKHVRTKKEILGEDGEIREGCHIVKKGEIYEKKLFTVKDERFKSNSFLDEVKRSYTDLINLYMKDEKLFGVKAQSDTDIKNERDGKDTGITRTARLFYVACTRAENSLAVVAYTENEELVKATALSNGWFLENEIYII